MGKLNYYVNYNIIIDLIIANIIESKMIDLNVNCRHLKCIYCHLK